jgi:molecular chaperone DnaK (HSP70)
MSYVIGIDLGTSNCAVAFADVSHGATASVHDLLVPQIQRVGQVGEQPLLPSALYIPGENELPAGATTLPWGDTPTRVVGEFARWQGARVPGRLVTSAKSWLCHAGVDRTANILPWGAPADVEKVSPIEASAEYLRHIARAWQRRFPNASIAEQSVVVTVPASFDEVARALTVDAARKAGLSKFTLLEEPQAAFYDFTARHRHNLASVLGNIRLVLVVDVGGGTTDLTLVQVPASEGGPQLQRIAVGEHLMLGGDNMDAAVARLAEERMTSGGKKLSATQWTQLVQTARAAKEKLLSADAPDALPLSIAATGSKLFGNTLSAQLTRAEVEQLVVEGFFPHCAPTDSPKRSTRAALQELGLPYTQDAAITRHIAEFLRRHADAAFTALDLPRTSGALPRPDAILLNGGVFNSARLSSRLVEVVSRWWPEQPAIPLLPHSSLDLAVARGAAYYGLVRHGLGRRISGGAAHGLYVGVASECATASTHAICVIPRGHEEGETVELRERQFQLTLGQPVQFQLFSTTSDRIDRAGQIVPVTDEFNALPPIHTLLKTRAPVEPPKHGRPVTQTAPVFLRATLTEIGTLELACVAETTNEQWRLEFEIRGTAQSTEMVVTESMPPRFSDAKLAIEANYTPKGKPAPAKQAAPNVKQLWATLEKSLGPRAQWTLPVLRELWTAMFAGAQRRRRSADHERIFFQITGYCLRPGFGYALDEWRCGETFKLFAESVEFHKEKPNWTEFWVMWRRIAAGLNEDQQLAMWHYLAPHLEQRLAGTKQTAKGKGIQPEGLDEMVRTAASLEELPVEEKIRLVEWILPGVRRPGAWAWALGRIGARVPIRGSTHKVVPPDVARRWVEALLATDLSKVDGAAFALTQIARMSGDRARDLGDSTRAKVLAALRAANASASWIQSVERAVELEHGDQARVLGDTLPVGLKLIP